MRLGVPVGVLSRASWPGWVAQRPGRCCWAAAMALLAASARASWVARPLRGRGREAVEGARVSSSRSSADSPPAASGSRLAASLATWRPAGAVRASSRDRWPAGGAPAGGGFRCCRRPAAASRESRAADLRLDRSPRPVELCLVGELRARCCTARPLVRPARPELAGAAAVLECGSPLVHRSASWEKPAARPLTSPGPASSWPRTRSVVLVLLRAAAPEGCACGGPLPPLLPSCSPGTSPGPNACPGAPGRCCDGGRACEAARAQRGRRGQTVGPRAGVAVWPVRRAISSLPRLHAQRRPRVVRVRPSCSALRAARLAERRTGPDLPGAPHRSREPPADRRGVDAVLRHRRPGQCRWCRGSRSRLVRPATGSPAQPSARPPWR